MSERLPNGAAVFAASPVGPVHRVTDYLPYTDCGERMESPVRLTYAQALVFMRGALCARCFGSVR